MNIVGVSACTVGIAHTYMAAEALQEMAGKMGVAMKVETNGSGGVKNKLTARKTISSTVLGKEGFFNLSLVGEGVAALESNVPYEELIEVELDNDELKIDGNLAVCWSSGLEFTVERSTKTLVGSAVSGEGFVNVYRGTGKVLMSPVAPTASLYEATHTVEAKPGVEMHEAE